MRNRRLRQEKHSFYPFPSLLGKAGMGFLTRAQVMKRPPFAGEGLDSVLSETEGAYPDAVLTLSKESLEGVS